MSTPWVVLIYGILVAAGGVMGYAKAGSTASLVAGAVSGLLLAGGAALMLKGNYQNGWWLSLVVTLLLLGRFGKAALTSGLKFMPGGMVIIVSLIVLAALFMNRTASR
ncbi:MAG: TMEM14 family protein [Acidobacteria bacterium]|nr:TMEM14 family protein [Acidobacteriota bacterium]MBI3422412.1 TMEM14 family protein [Acidobacteriota bacterium]